MDTKILIAGGVFVVVVIIIIVVVIFMTGKKTPTTTPLPMTTSSESSQDTAKLITEFQPNVNDNFAWKTIPSTKGKDLTGLDFTMKCSKPWYAYYQIGCKINDKTVYSDKFGPVYQESWQGPSIRIDKAGKDHTCFQLGGDLSVLRKRPSDNEMIDVTPYLLNNDRTGSYNGRDPVFTDVYKIDCDTVN
jgi:hypothetical protein